MKRSKLFIYVSFVAAAAIAAVLLIFAAYGPPVVDGGLRAWTGLAILMVLAATGERLLIRFQAGSAGLSVASIPIVAMVPLFGPAVAVAATAVSEVIGHSALRQKRSPIKRVFNTAQFTLGIGLGSVVYSALGGPVSSTSFQLTKTLLPLGGLILVYFLTNTTLVSAVIALDSGKRLRDTWRAVGPVGFANNLASSSFSLLIIFAFAEMGLPGLIVLLLPLMFVHHSYGVYLTLLQQNKEILELLVKTIEAKDPYTSGHSQRVATLSREIAEAMHLPLRAVEEVQTAALLHDIGKIDVAFSNVIKSPAELSNVEREIIRSHAERGAKLLASISSLGERILRAVHHHHEHFDGNGYPDGLAGDDIPLTARIIMVADTVDAMLSDRPYRSALTVREVEAELRRFSRRQFDPEVVRVFFRAGIASRAAGRADAARTPIPGAIVTYARRI